MCNCLIYDKEVLIKYICDEIVELEMDDPWGTYVGLVPMKYHVASVRWSLTKTNSRKWLERIFKNFSKEDLIVWAHRENFCLNQT